MASVILNGRGTAIRFTSKGNTGLSLSPTDLILLHKSLGVPDVEKVTPGLDGPPKYHKSIAVFP